MVSKMVSITIFLLAMIVKGSSLIKTTIRPVASTSTTLAAKSQITSKITTTGTSGTDITLFSGVKFGPPLSTSMEKLGILEPTPIQKTSIAPLTAGLSCILHAQTGSGKTLTYLLPLLKRLLDSNGQVDKTPLQGLIVVPTKELAVQVAADVVALLSKSDEIVDCSAVYLCLKTSRAGFDDITAPIVVGTPYKILDMLKMSSPQLVRTLNYLVLDEVDRMLVGLVLSKYATNDEKREAKMDGNPTADIISLLVRAKKAAKLPPMQVVAASATVGRPLRRELFRLLQGGEEYGDLTVLRPAEDIAESTASASANNVMQNKEEDKKTGKKEEKGRKNNGKESIEDLESYLEKALGPGSGLGGSFDSNNDSDSDQEQEGDAEESSSKRGGGQSGSTRKIGIPLGIRHLAILTRDDSNVLNSKVVAAKEKWVGEFQEAKRALLFVPRPEDVKQIIGMLQFWGVKEAQNLQETLGIEVETRAQQLQRGASDSLHARSNSGKNTGREGGSGGTGGGKFHQKNNQNQENEYNEDDNVSTGVGASTNDDSTELILRAARSRLGATSRLKDATATLVTQEQKLDPGLTPPATSGGPVNGRELFVAPVSGSRGLHLQDIEYVMVLTPPKTMDEYLHMAGRTGRAGNKVSTGTVVSLVNFDELKRMQSWQTALGIIFDVEYE